MNLLGHVLIGKDLAPLETAGNFTADACRANGCEAYARGVRFHRELDKYTDGHPAIKESRGMWPTSLRLYAGVLSDLAIDYVLSNNWDFFMTETPRLEFIGASFTRMLSVLDAIPKPASEYISRAHSEQFLPSYIDISGIRGAVERIVARRPRFHQMRDGVPFIAANAPQLASYYLPFLADARHASREWYGQD